MSDFFISEDEIKTTQEEIKKKEQEFGGDRREKQPSGIHDLFLCKVECEPNDQGVPVLKLTYNKDADQKTFRDVTKGFKFDSKDAEKLTKNKQMMIEHFYKGFGYTFKAAKDLKSFLNQVKQFEGKKLRAAIQVKQRLFKVYKKDENGNRTEEHLGYRIIDQPEIYYVGRIDQDLKMKPEKKYIRLGEDDLLEYEDHKKAFPERYDDKGQLKFEEHNNDASEPGHEGDAGTGKSELTGAAAAAAFGGEVDDLPW